GNNPVPHFLTWYYESLNVWLTPLRGFLLNNYFSRQVKNWMGKVLPARALVTFFAAIKVISFNEDVTKCKVRRAQVLWEEARRRGIKMKEVKLFGKPIDVYAADN